jgi:hypothetical protein
MTTVLERPRETSPATEPARTWIREIEPISAPEPKRSTSAIRTVDVIRMLGCAAAAIGFTSWLFFYALPLQGELGFVRHIPRALHAVDGLR